MSGTRRSAAIMGGLVCVTIIQTVTAFSCPMSMTLRSSEPTSSAGHFVGRRDAMGAFIIAAGVQMAALSFLQLKQLPEASGDFSELEVFKFQRGMRKLGKTRSFCVFFTPKCLVELFLIHLRNLAEDNMGSSDMAKIADAMGLSFNCIGSDLYRISKVIGSPTGYE